METNVIELKNRELTMSSLEMVEFINSARKEGEAELRHDNFMAKVPKVLGVDAPKFLGTQKYGNNNTREIYNFPKREACLMAMSYSYELQAKVFDRMTELENANKISLPDFTNPAEAAIAWAEQWKERERLQLQVEKDKPLVVMAETLMEADIGIKLQEFARIQSDKTGLGRNKLYNKLREWGILDKNNKPFQRCIDAGWFYIIERPFKAGEFEGVNRIVMLTPKGQNYVTNRLNKEE